MKKTISLLFILLISICGFSQPTQKGSYQPKVHEKIITMKSGEYYTDKGGEMSVGEKRSTKIYLYDNLLKLQPNDRLLPRTFELKNFKKNTGEECEIGKYVIYQAEIDNKPLKPTRYVTVYYSKFDECYYLEIEHLKYSELLKIK